MGNKNPKQINEEQKSNSSVLNLSLDSNKKQNTDSLVHHNDLDIIEDLKKEVNLPIENEYIESSEFSLEGKEEQLKVKFLFENNDENIDNLLNNRIFNKTRSKTYFEKILNKNTPKPHPKVSYEYISPLKLSIKSYGNIPKWNKKPNPVIYDFQKNIIDCKSCNDEENLDDFFFFNIETERTTPNVEDLQNLLSCRKKMTNFRNSIHDRTVKEYENILNSDYIFIEDDKKKVNKHHHKKNNFWNKYIKQQKLKNINKRISPNLSRLSSDNCYKRSETVNNESTKEHGLFILGILECAANEKKGRNTVNV